MTVLFKRLTVFRFLTVPPSAVHGLPKYDGIPMSTGTDVQHGEITSGIFPRTTLKNILCGGWEENVMLFMQVMLFV